MRDQGMGEPVEARLQDYFSAELERAKAEFRAPVAGMSARRWTTRRAVGTVTVAIAVLVGSLAFLGRSLDRPNGSPAAPAGGVGSSTHPTYTPVTPSPIVPGGTLPTSAAATTIPNDGGQITDIDPTTAALVANIKADASWFTTIGANLVDAVPDQSQDLGVVIYFVASKDVGAMIADHFGDPVGLTVRYEGLPAWTGPRGTLEVTVVDRSGRPVEGVTCRTIPVDPAVNADTGLAYSTDTNGIWKNAYLPATTYEVQVSTLGSPSTVLATGTATVPMDGTAWVRIVVGP